MKSDLDENCRLVFISNSIICIEINCSGNLLFQGSNVTVETEKIVERNNRKIRYPQKILCQLCHFSCNR